jgi:hypothetical protein
MVDIGQYTHSTTFGPRRNRMQIAAKCHFVFVVNTRNMYYFHKRVLDAV